MPALFAYGSLMFPEVLEALLGRGVGRDSIVDAVLPDHRRFALPGRPYPGAAPAAGHSVEGKVVTGLDARDVALLDAYEESFYERASVRVIAASGALDAFAYLDWRAHPSPLGEWDPETFRRDFLPDFVRRLRARRKM